MSERIALAGAFVAVAASRIAACGRVPDDYDAIGFQQAVERFDLAQLQPHFPGYPVYVMFTRVAHLFFEPLAAAVSVSAIASAGAAIGLFSLGRTLAGPRAGWLALAISAGAFGPWLQGSSARSDATAAAFAVWAFVLLVRAAPTGTALCTAAMLGVRASYWPLALSLVILTAVDRRLDRRARLASALVLVAGNVAWLVPLLTVVPGGARAYVALGRTHLAGHFAVWGGAATTRPEWGIRAFSFLRGLLYDGLFPSLIALVVGLGLLALALVLGRPSIASKHARTAALALAPYAAWVLAGQNVIEQPRHLLPLTLAAALVLALAFDRLPLAGWACALVITAFALPLLWQRRTVEPAAAQAARWAEAQAQRGDFAVFGTRSIRFFRLLAPSVASHEREWLSEVDVDLERLDRLPSHLLITSEIEVDAGRAPRVRPLVTFCRDARIDRAQPCLTLSSVTIGAVP